MGWIIGIIGLFLAIRFWKVSLVLLVLAGLLFARIDWVQDNKREERKAKVVALQTKIATAQRSASSDGRIWKLYRAPDPASDKFIPRTASTTSDDGLCSLSVEKRIDGSELTGLKCPGVKMSDYDDIYIKFDTKDVSVKMNIEGYSDSSYLDDSDSVYISPRQYTNSGYMSYKDFISGLITANAVAIKIPSAGGFWVRFSLNNAAYAINALDLKVLSNGK
jgi:hypothetical protein